MLHAADAALVRRDPALPGLATVLDPEALCARLRAALPDSEIEDVRATYVRYKPGTSCVVACRVRAGGTVATGYAKALAYGDQRKLAKAGRKARADGPEGPGAITLPDALVGFTFYPNDPDLPGLARMARPASRRALLERLLPERPELFDAALTPLRHKPERRFVGRLDLPSGPAAVLKIHRGDRGAHAAARTGGTAFRSHGALRIARRLAGSNRHHTEVFEWLAGRVMADAVADGSATSEQTAEAGAALAELHGQDARGLPTLTADIQAARVRAAAEAVGAVSSGLAADADRLGRRVTAWMHDTPGPRGPVHGDFSADQVLLTPAGAALIDLDEAALGDPAADLGSFAAGLRRDVLEGLVTRAWADELIGGLVDGHRDGLAPPRTAPRASLVDGHTAAWLVRLAVEPFRRRQPEWELRAAAILAEARALLDAR